MSVIIWGLYFSTNPNTTPYLYRIDVKFSILQECIFFCKYLYLTYIALYQSSDTFYVGQQLGVAVATATFLVCKTRLDTVVIGIVEYVYNHRERRDVNTTLERPIERQLVLAPRPVGGQIARVFNRTVASESSPIQSLGRVSNIMAAGLDRLVFDHAEERQIEQARRIMGEAVNELSDHELETYLTKFQYLLDTWFDEFERGLFENKTLQQLLKED